MNAAASLKLKPLNVVNLTDAFEVPQEGLSVGRDPANQVVLDTDQFPFISAVHARIEVEDDVLYLEDLDSKNGTLLNGKLVEERTALRGGDVIQFGREAGATFAVVSDTSATQTVMLSKPLGESANKPVAEFGHTTIVRLKEALGIPEAAATPDGKRRERPAPLTLLLFFALAVGIGIPISYLLDSQESVNKLMEENQQQLAEQQTKYDRQLQAYESRERNLRDEATELRSKIQEVELTGQGNLDDLKSQLSETNVKLEQYNPIEIERVEQERLKPVLGSIVYIETRVAFREKKGTRYLHEASSGKNRLRAIDFDNLVVGSIDSGSGFCVTADGYIISNAHVVEVTDKEEIDFRGDLVVRSPVIDVVFTGTSKRRRAEIVHLLSSGDDDFAILKIVPFEGIPYIRDFTVDRPIPDAGSAVRLFGFPLGKKLIQDRDTMRASIFMGSVSRSVESYVQVQSAVYPGNSGGPVVDVEGNVIGVVTAVQTVDGGQIASDIGFVLPIERLARIWPPTAAQ